MKGKKVLIILVQILILLIVIGVIKRVYAAQVSNLYTAEMMVAEQSATVNSSLVAQGLRQTLIKVSGRTDVVNNARVQSALAQPNTFIQQFSYQQSTTSVTTDGGRQVLAQKLVIEFDHQLINQLLSDAGIRPLGATRPSVLVWLVEERNGQRQYLGQDEDPMFATMRQQAQERGLPVFRPLLDLQDEQALPVSDAWGFFADSIRSASSRYQADAILVGRLYREGGQWQSDWQLLLPEQAKAFAGGGGSLKEQLASAVQMSADRLFADFVSPISGYDQGGVEVVIQRVRAVDDYFQIRNYLKELPAVRDIRLYSLEGDQLTLKLMIDGSVNQLQGAIALNPRFVPQVGFTTGAAPTGTATTDQSAASAINYRWQD